MIFCHNSISFNSDFVVLTRVFFFGLPRFRAPHGLHLARATLVSVLESPRDAVQLIPKTVKGILIIIHCCCSSFLGQLRW